MVNEEKATQRLAKLKSDLKAQTELAADASRPVALDQQAVGRLSRMDAMQQQAMSKATEAKRQADLVRIEAAERRLRDGDYGYCEECGDEIPDARLAVNPTAECCVNCAK